MRTRRLFSLLWASLITAFHSAAKYDHNYWGKSFILLYIRWYEEQSALRVCAITTWQLVNIVKAFSSCFDVSEMFFCELYLFSLLVFLCSLGDLEGCKFFWNQEARLRGGRNVLFISWDPKRSKIHYCFQQALKRILLLWVLGVSRNDESIPATISIVSRDCR